MSQSIVLLLKIQIALIDISDKATRQIPHKLIIDDFQEDCNVIDSQIVDIKWICGLIFPKTLCQLKITSFEAIFSSKFAWKTENWLNGRKIPSIFVYLNVQKFNCLFFINSKTFRNEKRNLILESSVRFAFINSDRAIFKHKCICIILPVIFEQIISVHNDSKHIMN